MKSLRLNAIASFISPLDKVADIGCDHAYLSIYLAETNRCQKIIATDINKNALESARKNIQRKKMDTKIQTYLSDGLKNVEDKEIDTIVISGVGTSTILHILDNIENFPIKKLVLQSNNDLPNLRKKVRKQGFYLQKEKVVWEKNHFYTIGVYTKKKRRLTIREIRFGIYDASNESYYTSIYNDLLSVAKKLNYKKQFINKLKLKWEMFLLKNYL